MTSLRRAGFTIIELLIVIAIIVILMGLLLSALSSAFETAYKVQCANNLHNIGAAYQTRASRIGNRAPAVAACSWVNQLKPDVQYMDSIFICPKDNPPTTRPPFLAYWHIRTTFGPPAAYDISMALPTQTPNNVKASAGRTDSWGDLVGTPGRVKSILGRDPLPGAWGVDLEDEIYIQHDWDYKDNRVMVEPLADGTYQVTCLYKNAGYIHDLAGPNHEILMVDLQAGKTANVLGAMRTSYGISGAVGRLSRGNDASKILLVEYKNPVADVVGIDAKDSWPDLAAPRHKSLMNVLYVDGHLETVRVSDVDPRVGQLQHSLWRPTDDK